MNPMAAKKRMQIVVILSIILTSILSLKSTAESDCQKAISSLSPCYAYVGERNPTTPPPDCCHQVENMFQTEPVCLCEILDEDGLNKTRILALPKACNLKSPPFSTSCYSPLPPPSGYSNRISYSLLLYVLAAASYAGIFIVI